MSSRLAISRYSAPRPDPFAIAAALLAPQMATRLWKLGDAHGWHERDCPVCGADHARPDQLQPGGDWTTWLILTGRGWGKTRTGAEWLAEQMEATPDSEWAIIAPKLADARTVCVEGKVGLLRVLSTGVLAGYNKNTYEVLLTNGAKAFLYGAEEPRVGVRGRNLSGAWCDELASWRYREVWDEGLMPALRVGERPRVVVTTTPKTVPLIRELAGRDDASVHVTRGSTFDNAANLSPAALEELKRRYEGTRLGRQELYAEIIDDVEGALWTRSQLEASRVRQAELPTFVRIVIGVDPSGGVAETGIIVGGLGVDRHGYILDDCTVGGSPNAWGAAVIDALDKYQGDRIVAEVNQGGAMVSSTIRTVRENAPIRTVRAARAKQARAEPVAALYEQGRVHHVGAFPLLEDQMCGWEPNSNAPSPDRLDALVWALTDLMLGECESTPEGPQVVTAGRSYG